MVSADTGDTRLHSALKKIWGYSEFRPPQQEIAQCLLAQRDALIVLPTGAGKSIGFQLPALMQPGLTLVVSPLVALMENQVQELRQRRLPAALLHNELPSAERRQTLWALEQQKLRLLYLSPETLLSPPLWEKLCDPDLQIQTLVLDEAHCLVQWGESFRPAYYRLGAVRPALLRSKPPGTRIAIAAFTATADPQAQQTIQHLLHLDQPEIFRVNPFRPHLRLTVKIAWTPRGRRQQLLQWIRNHPRQAGLVYVRTRRDSEELADWLKTQGYAIAAYHAGLAAPQRRAIEQAWLSDQMPFVICTCAFGLGVNKPNVRWIVHFQPPALLSEYVQEIGRAGRDGKQANLLMLVSEPTGWLDNSDRQRQQFMADQLQKHQQTAQKLMRKLPSQGDITTVTRQFPEAAHTLAWLQGNGQLHWQDPFYYALKSDSPGRSLSASNTQALSQMSQYLRTRDCRWQFLLRAFGFATEAQMLRCGQCDNCRPA